MISDGKSAEAKWQTKQASWNTFVHLLKSVILIYKIFEIVVYMHINIMKKPPFIGCNTSIKMPLKLLTIIMVIVSLLSASQADPIKPTSTNDYLFSYISAHEINHMYHGAGSINNRGVVTCAWFDLQNSLHPFVWSNGHATELPLLPDDTSGSAYAINDGGQVVGFSNGDAGMHAVIWQMGSVQGLGTLPGFTMSWARGINIKGEVVGSALGVGTPYSQPSRAFLWRHGHMEDLGCLPGLHNPHALAINNRGQIVGWAIDAQNHTTAMLWDHGSIVNLGFHSHRLLSEATAINNYGVIVGDSGNGKNDIRATIWRPLQLAKGKKLATNHAEKRYANSPLGHSSSIHNKKTILVPESNIWSVFRLGVLQYATMNKATAINDAGMVIGVQNTGHEERPMFIWDSKHGLRDIMSILPAYTRYFPLHAFGVNTKGQILAWGDYRGLSEKLYVMTPADKTKLKHFPLSSRDTKLFGARDNLARPATDIDDWRLAVQAPASSNEAIDGTALRITNTFADGTDWRVILFQRGIPLVEGHRYRVKFRVRADRPRLIRVSAAHEEPDYHTIGLDQKLRIDTRWRLVTLTFVALKTTPKESVAPRFQLGQTVGSVWIDHVSITDTYLRR